MLQVVFAEDADLALVSAGRPYLSSLVATLRVTPGKRRTTRQYSRNPGRETSPLGSCAQVSDLSDRMLTNLNCRVIPCMCIDRLHLLLLVFSLDCVATAN